MSDEHRARQYNEKDEKDEKNRTQHEKDEKNRGQEEKSWEEKWRRDPLNAAVWAIIIIWAGVVLLAANFGIFEDSFLDSGPLFFVGAGVILLLEGLFRLMVPAYRQPFAGNFVLAVVFLAIGLGWLINWNVIWAVGLITIGAYVLLRGALRPR